MEAARPTIRIYASTTAAKQLYRRTLWSFFPRRIPGTSWNPNSIFIPDDGFPASGRQSAAVAWLRYYAGNRLSGLAGNAQRILAGSRGVLAATCAPTLSSQRPVDVDDASLSRRHYGRRLARRLRGDRLIRVGWRPVRGNAMVMGP